MTRKPYPSDVRDDEWAFVAPYLTLMKEDAPQRDHDLREVFNGLRWMVPRKIGGRSAVPTMNRATAAMNVFDVSTARIGRAMGRPPAPPGRVVPPRGAVPSVTT